MALGETSLHSTTDKRIKRFHTRSRTGCVTCRQRHVRCDEKRPRCTNCISGSRSCNYPHANIPLRDRRATKNPGEQEPWTTQSFSTSHSSEASPASSVTAVSIVDPTWRKSMSPSSFTLGLGEALDPFDTMHFKMPLKSKELLHYFYHTGSCFDNIPGTQNVTANMHDPFVFRNVLLIAGLHYAWNVGDLSSFDSTFLFHKVQSIRTINTWIGNCTPSVLTSCLRHIATLSVIESCLGNFEAAETHLDGLLLLMDTRGAYETMRNTPDDDLNREFAERYLIMAFNLVHSLKSRFDDFMVSAPNPTPSSRHMGHKEIAHLIHQWHEQEDAGVLPRLRALNLFPSFFSPISPGVQIKQIDAERILCCLREITAAADLRYSELYHGTAHSSPYHLWASSGPSKLFVAAIDTHISSTTENSSDTSESSQDLKSSWSGLCVVVALYLTSVLGVWNLGEPAENRLMYHILRILSRDLKDNFADVMQNDTAAQDLWFWKAFLGALSLAHVGSVAAAAEGYARLMNFVPSFDHYIRTWARITGICKWEHARDRLENIVFPIYFQREALAKVLWNRVISASEMPVPDLD